MGIEIEKKFLVKDESFKIGAEFEEIRQAYLSTDPGRTVRVRIYGDDGFITIKGKSQNGMQPEFEYSIPKLDALQIFELCPKPWIEKIRYRVEFKNKLWEVDEFFGDNRGLIVAEIELESPDEFFEMPPWAGKEVTGDHRYSNSHLSKTPFREWKEL